MGLSPGILKKFSFFFCKRVGLAEKVLYYSTNQAILWSFAALTDCIWLKRGGFHVNLSLCSYIHYVSKHIKALLDLGCHVIMVFDGRPLPAKKVWILSDFYFVYFCGNIKMFVFVGTLKPSSSLICIHG